MLMLLPLVLLFVGCPKRVVDFGAAGEPTSVEDLLGRISAAEAQITSLKGDARLGVDTPQGKGSVTLFVAVADPVSIHLEQLDFFGRPQAVLISDGERFGLINAEDGRYYRGPATAANLGRFLPVVMPPKELAAIMLGRAPRMAFDASTMRFDALLGQYVVELSRGPAKQTLHVEPPSYRVVKSTAEGIDAYELTFGDLSDVAGFTLPKRVAIEVANAKTRIELVWKEFAVNDAPDMAMFDLDAPEGMPVVDVDAKGIPRP